MGESLPDRGGKLIIYGPHRGSHSFSPAFEALQDLFLLSALLHGVNLLGLETVFSRAVEFLRKGHLFFELPVTFLGLFYHGRFVLHEQLRKELESPRLGYLLPFFLATGLSLLLYPWLCSCLGVVS